MTWNIAKNNSKWKKTGALDNQDNKDVLGLVFFDLKWKQKCIWAPGHASAVVTKCF